jgi:hypothetical protein
MHRSCHPHARSDAHIKQLALQYTFVFIVRNAHYNAKANFCLHLLPAARWWFTTLALGLFVPASVRFN